MEIIWKNNILGIINIYKYRIFVGVIKKSTMSKVKPKASNPNSSFPSKTGNPSGSNRTNNPPKTSSTNTHSKGSGSTTTKK